MHTSIFKLLAAGAAALALGGFGLYALTAADPPTAPDEPPFVNTAPVPAEKGWGVKYTFDHRSKISAGKISAVAYGPDLIVTGDEEGVLVLWDVRTGKQKEVITEFGDGRIDPQGRAKSAEPIDYLRFSPDGTKVLVIVKGGESICQFPVEKKDREFSRFTPSSNQPLKTLGVTPDGKYWLHAANGEKESRLLFTPNVLGERDKFGNSIIFSRKLGEFVFNHPSPIEYAAADTAEAVATATRGRGQPLLTFWSEGKDKPLWQVNLNSWETEHQEIMGVLVAPGGKWVAVTGVDLDRAGQVWVFDAKTGKRAARLGGFTGVVLTAAFSPDGKQIVAGCSDNTARVYDVESGKELAVLKGHTEPVRAVAFSPGGRQIVTGSSDQTVRVWEYHLVAAAGVDDKLLLFETILKEQDGGPKKAAEVVIRSEKEWKAFVETCTSNATRAKLGGEKVDFDKEIIVAVAIGRNSSSLTNSEHKQAGVQKVRIDGNKATVEYCVVESDSQKSEPAYPLHVIKMPIAKGVTFKKTEKTFGG